MNPELSTGTHRLARLGGLLHELINGLHERLRRRPRRGPRSAFGNGPFTEAKEVVGGYAIFDVKSKKDMIEWTLRFMDLHKKHMPGWEGEAEGNAARLIQCPCSINT